LTALSAIERTAFPGSLPDLPVLELCRPNQSSFGINPGTVFGTPGEQSQTIKVAPVKTLE
jgi:hypothetical protein